MYQQRMASEIRVLEDQLYDADYQNRVLRDSLERRRVKSAGTSGDSLLPSPKSKQPDRPAKESPSVDDIDLGEGLESIEELELPMFDEGVPVDPDALTDPVPLVDPGEPGEPSEPVEPSDEDDSDPEMLPAPGGPEPPGKRDTDAPQVVPGELLPPPLREEEELKPPGQIILPDSVQAAAGAPQKLRIHQGLSGGHAIDGNSEGMMIVVNAIDKLGKTVSLDDFDIDAELSIVILDPQREPSQARIGRWDFTNLQVATFLRSEPISGLHVPIQWKDVKPSGKEVIVHVRLRAEDDEMRCEGRLKVEKKTAIAEWTPRGEQLR